MNNKNTPTETKNDNDGIAAGELLGVRAVELNWNPETVIAGGEPITNYFADTFAGTYTVAPYDRRKNLWMMQCGFDRTSKGRHIGSVTVCRAKAEDHWRKNIMASIEPNGVAVRLA